MDSGQFDKISLFDQQYQLLSGHSPYLRNSGNKVTKEPILWTRSKEDFVKDKQLFGEYCDLFLSIPCIHFEEIPILPIQGRPTDIIITSPRTIEFAKQDRALLSIIREGQCHCFGQSTAGTLEPYSKKIEHYPVSSSRELALHLDLKKNYLFIGPSTPAYDLATHINTQGGQCQFIPVYKTFEKIVDIPEYKNLKDQKPKGIVCFGSPSAVRSFKATFNCNELIAAVIGKTTAKVCGNDFKRVEISKDHNLAALVRLALTLASGKT